MSMNDLNLTPTQLETIRANSASQEAYESILQILQEMHTQQEDLMQHQLDTSHSPVIIYDEQGQVSYVNQAFTEVFGWKLNEIKGGRLDFITETHRDKTMEKVAHLFKTGEAVSYDSQRLTKQGGVVDVHIHANRLNNPDGTPKGMIVTLQIAKTADSPKHSPEALQLAQENLETKSSIIDNLNHLASEIAASLNQQEVWDTIARLTGEFLDVTSVYVSTYDPSTNTETIVADWISPEATPKEKESDVGVAYDAGNEFGYEAQDYVGKLYTITHADDLNTPEAQRKHLQEYNVHSSIQVPLIARDELIGFLEVWESRYKREFTAEEITHLIAIAKQTSLSVYNARLYEQSVQALNERQEIQKALASSEQKFKNLVESSITSIYIIQDGYYKYVNAAFMEMTGYTEEELTSSPVLDFIHEDDREIVEENIRRRLEGEIEDIQYKLRFLKKDGSYITTEVHGTTSEYEGSPAIIGSLLDVTAQELARQRIDYQATILQEISDAVIAVDSDFIVQAWNKAAEEMYGYKVEETIGHHVGEFIETQYHNYAQGEGLKLLLETGHFSDRATQFSKKGFEAKVDSSATILTDEYGQPAGFVAVNRDITKLIQAETELKQSQQRLEQLVKQSPLAFIEWDMNFCVREWNKAAEEIFGYTREEALGQHAKFTLTEEVWPIVDVVWEHLTSLTGGERSTNANVTANGDEIICDWYNSPLVDDENNVIGVISVVEDISERQKADEALKQSQQRLAQLVEQSPLAFIEWDLNFCVREWNKAAEEIFGYTRQNALGQHAKFILSEDVWPIVDNIWEHLVTLTGGERSTNSNITADGDTIMCEWYNTPLLNDNGEVTGVVSVIDDITERQRIEAERERLSEILENTTDFVAISDMDGEIIYMNQAGHEILQAKEGQSLVGKSVADVLPKWAAEILFDEAVPAAIKQGSWQGELALKRQDGTEIPVSQAIMAHTSPSGEVEFLSTIVRDITEQKQQEAAILKRQKLIQRQSELSLMLSAETVTRQGREHALQIITEEATRMLDVERASVWSYDSQAKSIALLDLYQNSEDEHSAGVVLDNKLAPSYFKALAHERILVANDVHQHYSTQELIDSYLDPLGITSMLDTFVRTADQVRGVVCLEHTGPKREWSLDEQGFANYLADLVAFIFEAEERSQLESERERLSEILENTTDFVGMADLEGNITYLNTAAKQMIGLTRNKDITKLNIKSIFTSQAAEKSFAEAIPTAIEQGYWQGESVLLHRNGREIPVSQVIIINKSAQGEVASLSTVIRDITEQKEQEDQIRLRLELSQALDQANTEAEVIDTLTTKAGFYQSSVVAFTKRKEVDGAIIDEVVSHSTFESEINITSLGTQINNAPPIFEAIEQNKPFITNNLLKDERLQDKFTQELAKGANITSLAILPIFVGGETRYGSLVIVSENEDYFNQIKIDLYRALAEQSSITLRSVNLSKQIQQSLERRSRQVQITTQIAQEIASATEIYELYQRVVDLIKEEFGYYHTQLLQYNPALDAVALVVGYGEVGQKMLEMGHSMPLGTGLIGTAASTGSPVLQSDVSQDPNWRPNALLPETCSELAVPIKFRNQVLGVLDVQSNVLGQLTEEDQIMLEGLCGQIAIAIESTRLRQDMNERLQELNNLQRLMTREGWQNFQSGSRQQTVGYLFDHNNVQALSQTKNGGTNGSSTTIEPIQIEDGKIVTNPIAVRGEVIGTLGLEESPDKPLSKDEQDLLDAISLQVAEALENARLIEQTRKRAIELETVARVSADTSTILEAEALLKSVVNLTQASFGLYHAHIYLFDDTERNLRLAAGTGEVGELMVAENWQIPLHDEYSIVARVARARRGMVVSDIRQELGYRPNPLMPETKAELVAPMIAGDEILGVLDLHSSTIGFFTQEDLRIHTTLATQVAVALQNANLYQEQLETAEKLREFDRLKSQFLASMSHELRTPLNSIIGFADVLLEGIDGELNERMREDVLLIRDGGQHLRALIGDILDMSKIEAGMMDLTYSNLEIQRIANEVMATTQGLVKDKPIELILTMGDNLSTIEADRTRLVQILLNLLSNAAKFTDEGEIELSLKADGDFLRVGVRDSGIGIKEEDISQVFEQFRQIGGMEHRKAGGTGLGMPITKQLVELHGGKIWIESVYEQGTTFWFTIPFERPDNLDNKREGYYA